MCKGGDIALVAPSTHANHNTTGTLHPCAQCTASMDAMVYRAATAPCNVHTCTHTPHGWHTPTHAHSMWWNTQPTHMCYNRKPDAHLMHGNCVCHERGGDADPQRLSQLHSSCPAQRFLLSVQHGQHAPHCCRELLGCSVGVERLQPEEGAVGVGWWCLVCALCIDCCCVCACVCMCREQSQTCRKASASNQQQRIQGHMQKQERGAIHWQPCIATVTWLQHALRPEKEKCIYQHVPLQASTDQLQAAQCHVDVLAGKRFGLEGGVERVWSRCHHTGEVPPPRRTSAHAHPQQSPTHPTCCKMDDSSSTSAAAAIPPLTSASNTPSACLVSSG